MQRLLCISAIGQAARTEIDMRPALRDARPAPYWLDRPGAPESAPQLQGTTVCDLAVVGGGYSGLWTALIAKERDPSLDVVIVEAGQVAGAASGRNGGFCESSLTHGLANGAKRWPDEIAVLERLGRDNLDSIEKAVLAHGIDCDFERVDSLSVATRPWELAGLDDEAGMYRSHGYDVDVLDAAGLRGRVDSPTYLGGVSVSGSSALVDPAHLAWGLRRAAERLGVRIYENTPALGLESGRSGRVTVIASTGRAAAPKVVLATNAFPPLLRRLRPFIVPVYDYALMTEPLSGAQLEAIGWADREGISDRGNLFHYYRRTADNRILFGGYDAVYHRGSRIAPDLDQRPATFDALADHFATTFPQLDGLRFTHQWGGVIDTCTRFSAFFGTALHNRVAYALGFTGLGVGATRFGAEVMLDKLGGIDNERTQLRFTSSTPVPFPPEPIRAAAIAATTRSLSRADRTGRRNLWLRTLDRMGLGFDS